MAKIPGIKIDFDTSPLEEALEGARKALLMTSILSQIGSEVLAPVERERPTKLEHAVATLAGTIRVLLDRDDLDMLAHAVDRPRVTPDEAIEVGDRFVVCEPSGSSIPGVATVNDIITSVGLMSGRQGRLVVYYDSDHRRHGIFAHRLTRYVP